MGNNQAYLNHDDGVHAENTSRKTSNPPSWLSLQIAGLAGYDLMVIPDYCPDSLIEHERKKLFRIGLSVFIPSFFGFICSYYLFGKYIHQPLALFLSATAFALLLLVVDCIIVTTLSKASLLGLFIRLAMSICIGIVVSEPALLVLYEKTITARIESELSTEKTQEETSLNGKLGVARTDLTKTQADLLSKNAQFANYSDDKIAHIRAMENEKRKKERLASLADSKKPLIAEQQSVLEGLLSQRTAKGQEIENKLLEMDQEAEGKRGSGKAGKGSHWTNLKQELTTLKKEETALNKKIDAANKELALIQDTSKDASQLNEEFKGRLNGVAKLTAEEQTAKTALAGDISALQQKQTDYRNTVDRIESELAGLGKKYATDTRDDSLTATRVLYQIAQENPVLLIKVLSLFGLIFFIDTIPTLVKLTVKTGYEDFLKQQSQKIQLANQTNNTAYDQECNIAATDKFNKLDQLSQHLSARLAQTSPQGQRYPHEKILHHEAHRLMATLANQLAQLEPAGASISVRRKFGLFWTSLKTKFGRS
ncbi:MAG: DUF4407 domain-containing protein [Methylococcales bacterium]|nr:DUF4407 domain-containing protein [Methylococcales bacterium]